MTDWRRLSKRMLLVHPVTEFTRFVPVLIASVFFGSRSGENFWPLLALALIVTASLLRWVTTSYRIGPERIELRTGVFGRKMLSVPRDRIRSVDIEANVLHRVLGLAVVHVGTGKRTGRDERFTLNGLDARRAPELRRLLLAHTDTHTAEGPAGEIGHGSREIGHWRASWAGYAALSLTGLALFPSAVAVLFRFVPTDRLSRSTLFGSLVQFAERGAGNLALIVAAGVLTLLLVSMLFSCLRYLTTYFRLRIVDNGTTLHISHGLLATRATTLDRSKLRGATMHEPLLLRLVGGAELTAIMTGTKSPRLLPQAPHADVERVLADLLGDRAYASAALRAHGPAARRRRYLRTLAPVLAGYVAVLAVATSWPPPWWTWLVLACLLAGAAGLAADRYHGLGHAVLGAGSASRWLITRRGSISRDRDALAAAGIVGWVVRQSFFQRRSGLATVVAATPAGKRAYHVVDIPIADAWLLIEALTPGLTGPRP